MDEEREEIISPGHTAIDLVSTCIWYVKNGVQIALVIDPDKDTALRFLPDALPDVLTGDGQIDLCNVLPGFELTVSQFFASLLLD